MLLGLQHINSLWLPSQGQRHIKVLFLQPVPTKRQPYNHTHYTWPHFITFKATKKLVFGYLDLILKRNKFFPILLFSLVREIAISDF